MSETPTTAAIGAAPLGRPCGCMRHRPGCPLSWGERSAANREQHQAERLAEYPDMVRAIGELAPTIGPAGVVALLDELLELGLLADLASTAAATDAPA